jgi:hypothetical protein
VLQLSNLSVGGKLVATAGLCIALMAGMIATMLTRNSSLRSAIAETMVGESIAQAASDSRASIRGLQVGLRDTDWKEF